MKSDWRKDMLEYFNELGKLQAKVEAELEED